MIWPWQDRSGRLSLLKAVTFAWMFAPATWLIQQVETEQFGPVPLGGMTYWSGLWATALLLLALAMTPASVILRSGAPVLVRRVIGVTALAYTIAHVIIYFALRFWDFSHIVHEMTTRISLILAAIATLGLAALGATSLDAAVRRMAKGWQTLHNMIYVICGLALIHYLLSPDIYPEQYLTSGIFFWLLGWRLLNRRALGTDARALMVLAVASCLFTALLEILWLWAYQDIPPFETLANNFNLDLGLSPAWKVLVLGLLVAAVAVIRLRALHLPPQAGRGRRAKRVG